MERLIFYLLVIGLLLLGSAYPPAFGFTLDANGMKVLSDTEYYESLKKPLTSTPCCGPADAYYADRVGECNRADPMEDTSLCVFVVFVTDTRPDKAPYYGPSGYRLHIPVGTRIPIPPWVIRRPPIPNPTGHNIVFLGSNADDMSMDSRMEYIVHCFEPHSGQ